MEKIKELQTTIIDQVRKLKPDIIVKARAYENFYVFLRQRAVDERLDKCIRDEAEFLVKMMRRCVAEERM